MTPLALSAKQQQQVAHADPDSGYSLHAAVGAVRSGKTVAATLGHCAHIVNHGLAKDHAVVGVTETSLRRNLIYPQYGYLSVLRSFGLEPRLRSAAGGHVEIPLANGKVCRIWMFGGQDAAAAENRMAGATIGSMLVDELTRIPESVYLMAWTRLSYESAKVWVTLNPAGTHHWARRAVEDAPDSLVVRFRMDDNPSLSDAVKSRIASGLTGAAYRRLILGEWADVSGLIYPHWHYGDRPAKPERWEVGIDWASSGVFAAVLLCRDPDGNRIVVAERRHDANEDGVLTDTEHALTTHQWATTETGGASPRTITLRGDPATSAGFQREMKRLDWRWRDGDNAVLPGIQSVASLLETRRLLIGRHVPHLVGEIGNYSWDATAAAKGEDKPVKRDDHLLDALRYVCHRSSAGGLVARAGF